MKISERTNHGILYEMYVIELGVFLGYFFPNNDGGKIFTFLILSLSSSLFGVQCLDHSPCFFLSLSPSERTCERDTPYDGGRSDRCWFPFIIIELGSSHGP